MDALLTDIRAVLAAGFAGSPAITIGVVDGIPDLSHPSLRLAEIDVLTDMIPPSAGRPDSHATAICSVIFGSGHLIKGIAPGCRGLALPIFFGRRAESRARPASQLDLARAITFALEHDVAIINVSAGQKTSTPEAEAHLEQALRQCRARRVLLVAAAGNDGCACIHLPAGAEQVLAVGAADAAGRPLEASNWGEAYRHRGLLAPGHDIAVAALDGGTARASGTSYATAVVSAVAALLLSIARDAGYVLDPLDLQQILIDSAAPCTLAGDGACERHLAGTLDAAAALALLHRTGTTSTTSGLRAAGILPSIDAANEHQRALPIARGEPAMSSSSLEQSDIAAGDAPGLSPSACSCEKKPEDETERKALKPQGFDPVPLTAPPLAAAQNPSEGLNQLACGCGGGQPPQIVFALGALWFDFGTEARLDALIQQSGGDAALINSPPSLLTILRERLHLAAGITFILMQDQIPLYAVQPAGPFALQIYTEILDTIQNSFDQGAQEQRVSIAGVVAGSTTLLNGMTVPVIFPDLRGMFRWNTPDLIAATAELGGDAGASDEIVGNFLSRVYYELRNLGVAPSDRALNFAATNAFQARTVFADALVRRLDLDSVRVVRSPICRPDSDCWDVQLQMFDPENERRAGRIYRFTIDVSEVVPVTVGPVRTWAARLGTL